jgi:bifunctional non-homologous end joining protein LigD
MLNKRVRFIHPMLAKEVFTPFSDDHWIYEVKWNGHRAIADLDREKVLLYSRKSQPFNLTFPTVVDALRGLNLNVVLDGEIVAIDERGRSSFHLLQQYGQQPGIRIQYQVFDLLYKDGQSLEKEPLLWRKTMLRDILKTGDVIRYSDHIREKGVHLFQKAMVAQWEGIMGKKIDSPYREGLRSADWVKIKMH